MKTAFRKSFPRDLKKISGTTHCYRIRIGEYRIGVVVDGRLFTRQDRESTTDNTDKEKERKRKAL